MSDIEKGIIRAEGELLNFLADMRYKLEREGRSQEYKSEFWANMDKLIA